MPDGDPHAACANPTRISIIIPTWNEARIIADAVSAALRIGDEVIVVDSASPDATAGLAARAGARVIECVKGRGRQLHAGACAARGDILLFLHADARLPAEARAALLRATSQPWVAGGNFYLRFEPATWAARFFTWANHVRRLWLRIYYGDSAIFVRREVYQRLGGFRPLPILEDYDFARRLERFGKTTYLSDVSIVASSRRFVRAPWQTLFIWIVIQALHLLGVAPSRLARLYADIR